MLERPLKTFQDRFYFIMKKRGWRSADVARASGLSKAAISAIISDPRHDMKASSLIAIAKALGCDPLWLHTGKESGDFVKNSDVTRVSVWKLSDLIKRQPEQLWHLDSGRHIHTERAGRLFAVVAEESHLSASGILNDDICIIAANDRPLRHSDIVLVRMPSTNKHRLLKVIEGLSEMMLVTDDQRQGSISLASTELCGRMIEARRSIVRKPPKGNS